MIDPGRDHGSDVCLDIYVYEFSPEISRVRLFRKSMINVTEIVKIAFWEPPLLVLRRAAPGMLAPSTFEVVVMVMTLSAASAARGIVPYCCNTPNSSPSLLSSMNTACYI